MDIGTPAKPEDGQSPRSQYLRQPWTDALAMYRAASDRVEKAEGDDATDLAANEQHIVLGALMRTRVPDLDALREKVRIAQAETGDPAYSIFHNLLADIDGIN